jgi:hypothetical protein
MNDEVVSVELVFIGWEAVQLPIPAKNVVDEPRYVPGRDCADILHADMRLASHAEWRDAKRRDPKVRALINAVVINLLRADFADALGSDVEDGGKRRNYSGGGESERPFPRIKKFSEMPEGDKDNVIRGAIFVIGVLALFTYLAIQKWRGK